MSYSSLWGINQNYAGHELTQYQNSWLFTPVIMGILPEKYIPEVIQTPYGYKKSILGIDGNEVWIKTNEKINHCKNMADMVCWEMCNQQVFFTKDKKCIADSIRIFVEQNTCYDKNYYGNCPLKQEYVASRFLEIAKDIEELNEKIYPYFVFKNTSCDDNVEYWFEKWNEENEDYEERSLKECDKNITEFVLINHGEITGFIANTEYHYD